MSAQILSFPGYQKTEEVRQDTRIEDLPTEEVKNVPVIEPKPPVYVRVRADAFTEMMNALVYYGAQHFDHGKRAREVMDSVFGDQSA